MKLGRTPWAVLAAIVAIAIGWFVMRPDDRRDPSDGGGGVVVVEQPSGKVIESSPADEAPSATAPARPEAPDLAAGGTPSADSEPDDDVSRAAPGDSVTAPAGAPADLPSVPVAAQEEPAPAAAGSGDRPLDDAGADDAASSGTDAATRPAAADRDKAPDVAALPADAGVPETAPETADAASATGSAPPGTAQVDDAASGGTGGSGDPAPEVTEVTPPAAAETGDPSVDGKDVATDDKPSPGDTAADTSRLGGTDADQPPDDKEAGADDRPAPASTDNTPEADDTRIAALPPDRDEAPPAADGEASSDGAGDAVPDDPDAPSLDLVRVEPDGQAVLAGRAAPDTPVDILIDGKVIETVRTDASGNFVAILQTHATGEAQNLQLRVADPDAAETVAADDEEPVLRAPDAALERPAVRDAAGVETGAGTDATVARAPQADRVAAPASGDAAAPKAPERIPEADAADTGTEATATEKEPAEPTPPTPGELAGVSAPGAPDRVRTGGTDRPVDGVRIGRAPADGVAEPTVPDRGPAVPDRVADRGFLTSAPVIILPGATPDDAPTVLSTTREDLKIVQPSVTDINSVVLDRISYRETGDVLLEGRGRAGKAVRIYGNGLIVGTTRIASDGTWAMTVDQALGQEIKLLRMDEIDQDGRVVTRVEAPFTYSRFEPKLVRQREVVIQKGDMLWRIAEQYYGEGIRYSVIYGANSKLIRDPDLIYPGQVFTVPELIDADD